ncbi:MAG: hypothetical protein M3416_04255 [Acidobacteriota bacterium]|nr:hypothetical protein [Acidobacteriota bacterium]
MGAPGPDLPDLDESRRVRTSPEAAAPAEPITANLPCLDCDPSGGGGGGSVSPSDPYFATARTRPVNETGGRGVTLGSRNFNWGLSLVSLPGRAGLDLSLALHYNSLVWTKQGTSIQFNADHGTPGPGFQMGLPRLQARHLNSDTNTHAYILITPSGGRVELKQVGTDNIYEARDGSFIQLTFEGTAATPVVRIMDGTQYRFGTKVGAEWRCTQIKDRNGNYISATYNATNGHLLTMTDTLGRVVTLNYNADGNLSSVTQTWGTAAAPVTHTYATFTYGTVAMALNFSGLTVFGATNGASQPVLASVTLSTGHSYHFDYNSYGQVFRIRHKALDGSALAQTAYTFNLAAAQTDCPRFSEQRDWARSHNGDDNGVVAAAEESVTAYSQVNNSTWTDPETNTQQTGTLVQLTAPDGTIHKRYSRATGWDAGLPRLSEAWAGGVRRKWTSVEYTQDNTALSFAQNPRVTEVNIYDGTNRRRITVDYTNGFNLPTHVREWGGATAQTLLRMKVTGYKQDSIYVSRRIIGLPYERLIYDGPTGRVMSREVYHYDWAGENFSAQAPSTNYTDPGYVAGRGNLTAVQRFNCTTDTAAFDHVQAVYTTLVGYNMAGSALWSEDADGHRVQFGYADSFSDAAKNTRNTLAYPTRVTDADGFVSTTQYNFDFGAVTLTTAPTSGTGTAVTYADTQLQYDAHGRLARVTLENGAYKRWVYDPTGRHVHTYETIRGTAQADEFHAWQVFDGAGRLRARAADHPGSVGGYTGQFLLYDTMGRLIKSSNPTEMDAAWVPKGDDAAWVYTLQAYDWQGRPTQTTNTDGTTRVLTYGGCGCAGGEVTTAQDEHGRGRRLTKDTLGRLAKVEELNWDETVYSTTAYTYNVRDQLTQISQQGQLRTFEYDGHGRLAKRTTPEQGATTYAYNSDDTVSVITDARGATTTYGYNARHLITSLTYGVAAGKTQTWAATANVTYAYDAAGHRASMADGQGTATYHYDSLGRLDWEERNFTAFAGSGDPPAYRLTYGYNVGGELTSLTNPFGNRIDYGYDEAGRASGVTGSSYGGTSVYASALRYRAFGALKAMTYANGRALSAAYDKLLRPTKWDVAGVQGYNYRYDYFGEKTGRVTFAENLYDATLDRSYEYDHLGRLTITHSGAEARAHAFSGQWGTADGPYSQGYDYDHWGNLTRRYGWGGDAQGGSPAASTDLRYTYTNNRRTGTGIAYDAAGNLKSSGGQTFAYDALGNQTFASFSSVNQSYDGDGLRVKKTEAGSAPKLHVRSTVLGGQVVAEVSWTGTAWQWSRGYVYLGSQLLAVQSGGPKFVHEDPVTKSKRLTDLTGAVVSAIEMDPWGADTNRSSNAAFQPRRFTSYERDANGGEEAMFRRYHRGRAAFDQPDPYDGSYDFTDPQSFNRYSYVQNDPVNFVDPTGLLPMVCDGVWQTDPATGQPYCVPRQDFGGVTVSGGGVEMHPLQQGRARLDSILMLMISQSLPPVDVGLLDFIRDKLEWVTQRSDCQDFLNAVGVTDPLGVFDQVRGQEGFVYTTQRINNVEASYTVGAVAYGNAQIQFAASYAGPFRGTLAAAIAGRQMVMTALHEVIHAAGPGDIEMAATVYAKGFKDASLKPPRRSDFKDINAFALASSNYWQGALSEACGFTLEEYVSAP